MWPFCQNFWTEEWRVTKVFIASTLLQWTGYFKFHKSKWDHIFIKGVDKIYKRNSKSAEGYLSLKQTSQSVSLQMLEDLTMWKSKTKSWNPGKLCTNKFNCMYVTFKGDSFVFPIFTSIENKFLPKELLIWNSFQNKTQLSNTCFMLGAKQKLLILLDKRNCPCYGHRLSNISHLLTCIFKPCKL